MATKTPRITLSLTIDAQLWGAFKDLHPEGARREITGAITRLIEAAVSVRPPQKPSPTKKDRTIIHEDLRSFLDKRL